MPIISGRPEGGLALRLPKYKRAAWFTGPGCGWINSSYDKLELGLGLGLARTRLERGVVILNTALVHAESARNIGW